MSLQKATLNPPLAEAVLSRIRQPAALLGRDRTILAANDLFNCRFCPAADAGGRKCHEVTHGLPRPCEEYGERCPLAAPGEGQVHAHAAHRGREYDEVTARPVRGAGGEVVAYLVISRPLFGGDRQPAGC